MPSHRIFQTKFAVVYPLYVQKAERKGRTKEDPLMKKIRCPGRRRVAFALGLNLHGATIAAVNQTDGCRLGP